MRETLTPLITGAEEKAARYFGHQTATSSDLDAFYSLMTMPSAEREEYLMYPDVVLQGNTLANWYKL